MLLCVCVYLILTMSIQPFCTYDHLHSLVMAHCDAAPGIVIQNGVHDVDFSRYPHKGVWNFDSDPGIPDPEGSFTEVPLSTFENPLRNKIARRFLRILAGPEKTRSWGDGKGVIISPPSLWERLGTRYTMMAFDGLSARELKYGYENLVSRGHTVVTLIGHPKMLSPFYIEQLDKFLRWAATQNVEFVGISDVFSSKAR